MAATSLLVLVPAILLLASRTNPQPQGIIKSTHCFNDPSYTSTALFNTDLNALLSALTTAAPAASNLSATSSHQSDPASIIYGVAQCLPDADATDCSVCLATAKTNIPRSCESADSRFNDCLVRYSGHSLSDFDEREEADGFPGDNNATDPSAFHARTSELMMGVVSNLTAAGSDFLVGADRDSGGESIYGMVQCIPNLSADDCVRCLNGALKKLWACCSSSTVARVLRPSCTARYDNYQFFDSSLLLRGRSSSAIPAGNSTAIAVNNSTVVTGGNGIAPGAPASIVEIPGGKKSSTWKIFLAIVIVVALILLCTLCICLRRRKVITRVPNGQEPQDGVRTYALSELSAATENFAEKNKLGQGGFGPVYKGELPDGKKIAVKRLSETSRQGLMELENEVVVIAKLQHRSLVTLLGSCSNEKEKLLVYEYLPNGSLDKILFGTTTIKQEQLGWRTRYSIIEGIGRGLLYLHKESRHNVIHRDLKASNILLDESMNPKISDFGFARLFDINEKERMTQRVAGTCGYMPPEYVRYKIISTSTDVFSYGVLVLEIVTGRKNSDFEESSLLSNVWQHWNNGNAHELMDQCYVNEFQWQEVERCIYIGLLCVQDDERKRPSMEDVLHMLRTRRIDDPTPTIPAFCHREGEEGSVNVMSISELQPRS